MLDYSQHGQACILRQLITPDMPKILVDIGAHDGMTNSNSRALLEQGWRSVLVEPSPLAFAQLRQNCRGFPNATMLQAACSDSCGAALMRVGVDGPKGQLSSLSSSSSIAPSLTADSIEVRTLTLEELLSAERIPPDFGVLLVDTEGLDLRVLLGLSRTTHRPRIIVTEDFAETDAEKYDFLSKLNYRFLGAWGADSVWMFGSHGADTSSLRLPISRISSTWQPSGTLAAGRVYLEFVNRQCLVGWAFCQADQVPPLEVVLDLRSATSPQRYVFRAARVPRADVAELFNSPPLWMSGFRACVDVPPGEYHVRVVQQENTFFSEAAAGPISIK